MNKVGRLEELLAALLRNGSWLASVAIGVGFILTLIDSRFGTRNLAILPNMRIATLGIVLLILLPSLRVLLMFVVFIRERDFRFAFIAAVVLAMILLGVALGFLGTSIRELLQSADGGQTEELATGDFIRGRTNCRLVLPGRFSASSSRLRPNRKLSRAW